MKKILFVLSFVLIPVFAFAGQSAISGSNSDSSAGSVSSVNIQNSQIPLGAGRLFPWPTQPVLPGLQPYLIPVTPGWNTLEQDLWKYLPPSLSLEEAKLLKQGKVRTEVRLLEKITNYHFDRCTIYYPGQIQNAKLIGYVFNQTESTPLDVLGDAAEQAMLNGGNAILIIKGSIETEPKAASGGISIGGNGTQIGGQDQTSGVNIGGGVGFSYGKTWKASLSGFVALILQEK
jgi:hypothetical protein